MPESPVLDAQVLETLRMLTDEGEPDVLLEVLGLFQEDTPGRVGAIVQAVAHCDADAIHRAAHSLKGSSGNIGARGLQHVCLDIETAARAGDLPAVAALMDALRREAAEVDREIARLLAAGQRPM